jgi:hypothetical protein
MDRRERSLDALISENIRAIYIASLESSINSDFLTSKQLATIVGGCSADLHEVGI